VTAIELAVWLYVWSVGRAPVPLVATYLALSAVALGIALGLRPLARRGEPRASWPVILLGTVLVGVSSSLFMALKFAIPSLVPFWLDKSLAAAEAGVCGVEPYHLLDSLFGRANLLVDRVYGLWLPVQLVVMFSVIVARPSWEKSRALAACSAAWFLLGVVAATLLSSAGPIFFDRVVGGDSFAPLHQILETRRADMALSTSDAMWSAYLSGHPGLVSGISAAPSMHIAISMWILLVARDLAPRAVPIAAAYLAFIWIASVQLGWHYVTDGITAIAGMTAIWWIAGRLIRRPHSRPNSAPAP
jgi:hypothetical protein